MKSSLRKTLPLLLTLLSGAMLLMHHLHYQFMLSTGDHGRDFYAFAASANGAVVYRDYWWVYGPLMPYYYALFFKIFGASIPAVLLGKFVLNLTAGAFFFLTLNTLIPGIFAYTATLWFWLYTQDFFFTYNHIGGIALLMAATYALIRYVYARSMRSLYWALVAVFALCFVKINFGLAALVVICLGVLATDFAHKTSPAEKKRFYAIALICLPAGLAAVYWSLLQGLPMYAVRQCLPYLSVDHPYNAPVTTTLALWWNAIAVNINSSWPDRLFAVLIITSLCKTAHTLTRGQASLQEKKNLLLTILIFALFYVFNIHEYLASGVPYRTFWAQPYSIFLIFLVIGTSARDYSKMIRVLLVAVILFIVSIVYSNQLKLLKLRSMLGTTLAVEKAGILTGNHPAWLYTVEQTTQYLKEHLDDDETFLALPYDPLYYFLTSRPSPTRQLIFFEHINIPSEQERDVIADIERHDVNYILLSSRINSSEPGLGVFGKTYCPLLGEYIAKNFAEIARFGDWQNHPGWGWNHGTMVLRRK